MKQLDSMTPISALSWIGVIGAMAVSVIEGLQGKGSGASDNFALLLTGSLGVLIHNVLKSMQKRLARLEALDDESRQ